MNTNSPSYKKTGFFTDKDEPVIWQGKPSQWINFKVYAYCILMILVIIFAMAFFTGFRWWLCLFFLYPAGRSLFAWFEVYSIDYKLTNVRLLCREGVFNRVTSTTELSQVKEVLLEEPWYKRIVGLGDIRLNFNGYAETYILVNGIKNADEVRELFSKTIKQYKATNIKTE